MEESSDIVYLETKMDRFKGRWRAMSRIARLGIVSSIFGAIGLLSCFFLRFIPFLSLPFSIVGLVIGGASFVAGFYYNLRRDGFWFPLTGLVLSLLGLAFAFGNWNGYQDEKEKEQTEARLDAIAKQREKFVGRWLKGNGDRQQSLEMTIAGSLLWKGPHSGTKAEETVAKYKFKEDSLVISFSDSRGSSRSMIRYSVDLSREDQLLLSDRRVVSGDASIDMGGVWKKVGPPRVLTAAEKQIADYQSKLERFRDKDEKFAELIRSFEDQKRELLTRLRPYEEGREKDENWKVWAQDLNLLVSQLDRAKQQKPRIEQAVVRLEASISRLNRQAELDQARLDTGQLEELLLTIDQLGDDLDTAKVDDSVEQFILEQMVDEELEKNTGSGND